MYDYPDGQLLPPVVGTPDVGGTAAADLPLGADVQFFGLRVVATAATTVVLWRPSTGPADTGTLVAASAYRIALPAVGDSWESSLFPANQRPPVIRVLATAGGARVEVTRVVRQ